MTLFQHIHPEAILSGKINLHGSALSRLPRVQGMYDWRVKQPRTRRRGTSLVYENGGSYAAMWDSQPREAVSKETERQRSMLNAPGQSNMIFLDAEDPRPCWEKADHDTKRRTIEVLKSRGVAAEAGPYYEDRACEWTASTIVEMRKETGLSVGSYDPLPAWVDQHPGQCVNANNGLDWAGIPLYVHFGYSSEPELRDPEWFRDQWTQAVERYRRLLPHVALLAFVCPRLEVVQGPDVGKRVPLAMEYLATQINTASDLGLDQIIWDDPQTPAELGVTDAAVKTYRKVAG